MIATAPPGPRHTRGPKCSTGNLPQLAAVGEDLGLLRVSDEAAYSELGRKERGRYSELLGPQDQERLALVDAELALSAASESLLQAQLAYLERSQQKLEKVKDLYQSLPVPEGARGFGLSLYHCLSEVEDAVTELERYTMGYVDSYLHDGREMLREAKHRRQRLQQERRRLEIA